jgi:hypothetical protein
MHNAGMVLALQFVLPIALLVGIARFPPAGKGNFWIQVIATAFVLFAVALAGLWLALPWWLANVYPIVFGVCTVLGGRRSPWTPGPPSGAPAWIHALGFTALGAFAASVVFGALSGRIAPDGESVDLAFPLGPGTYLVANGGSDLVVNSHQRMLDASDPRLARFRGTAHGVDFVALDGLGLTAKGIAPDDPKAHHVFGREVLSPCEGEVIRAENGHRDMPVGEKDRDSLAGNHAILRCGAVEVVLAHLAAESLVVKAGDRVRPGSAIGRAGNSGASDAPHLHIHAQKPGSPLAPLGGEPVAIRFEGRYLVRSDRHTVR